MGNDEEYSPEDFPIDGEMVGIGPDHQFSTRTRLAKLQQLRVDAEGGDVRAIDELLKTALLFSERIDFENETSPDRIALAFMKKPLEYLLGNKNAMLTAFDIPLKKSGRRKSKEREERNKGFVKKINRDMADDSTLTLKKAKEKVLKDINEAMDISTLDRAYREYVTEVKREKIEADVTRILEEKYSDEKKQ